MSEGNEPKPKLLGGCTGKGFMPGQSGNPEGRPRTKKLTQMLLRRLDEAIPGDKKGRTYFDLLIEKAVRRACNRSDTLVQEIFNRIEGKPVQRMELAGPDGGSIPLNLAELDQRLAELIDRARSRSAPARGKS